MTSFITGTGATPTTKKNSKKKSKKKKKKSKKTKTLLNDASVSELKSELLSRDKTEEEEEDYFVMTLSAKRATQKNPAKVIILGGGPAGLTAAIYCARGTKLLYFQV